MYENICRFVPYHKDTLSVHTINFVYETKKQTYDGLKSDSVYKMYYVCSGRGYIYTPGKVTPLTVGDLFFTFPSACFAIESEEDFTYMYISFVGLRVNRIMESLNIHSNNFLFHQANEVCEFWQKGLSVNVKVMDLISESVLLYTFSFLGDRMLRKKDEPKQNHCIQRMKKYIDDHFTDPQFSLERMSGDLSYNKKYLSHSFKKNFGIGITEYVSTIRIQNACTMMKQDFTSVSDIATRCGYADAQYFSKMFKAKMGVTPTAYIKTIQAKEKAR